MRWRQGKAYSQDLRERVSRRQTTAHELVRSRFCSGSAFPVCLIPCVDGP